MDHTVIERLNVVLLLFVDLSLGFDNIPKLDKVIFFESSEC